MEYSPTSARGYLLGAVLLLASVAGVLTLFVAISESSAAALVIAAGCMVLALVAWWALLSWSPTTVRVHDGVLDVARRDHIDRFDLADPATEVTLGSRPGLPGWTATFKEPNGPRVVIRSSQVKARQFTRIVEHHRARAHTGGAGRPSGAEEETSH